MFWKQLFKSLFLTWIMPAAICITATKGQWQAPTALFSALRKPDSSDIQIPVLHPEGSVENMDLEEYLVCVLLGEVSSEFHAEALKAQAVAARTYTLRTLELGYKHEKGAVCTDYRCCQAYREPEEYLNDSGSKKGLIKVQKAVEDTCGQVLLHQGKLICATYFASSGGRTEDAVEVWGEPYPYLKAVSSPGEENCGYYSQKTVFTPLQLQQSLGVHLEGEPPSWFGIVTYTAGGGVDLMRIGGRLYTGVELRRKLGLRSTIFQITPAKDGITVDTLGYGHRVGLSQHGANAMAHDGYDYTQILTHYYTGVTLTQYPLDDD